MVPRWVVFSIASALGYGVNTVITTQATLKGGIGSTAFTTCTHIVGAVLFGLLLLVKLPYGLSKNGLRDAKRSFTTFLPWAMAIAFVFWFGDVAVNAAYAMSPNPGYCDSISDLESVIGAIIAFLVFAAPVTKRQIAGMILAVFSLHFLQV